VSASASHGLMAAFEDAEGLLDAARRVRAAGYREIDAYAPYPIEGLSEAMGLADRHVPLLTLLGGLVGGLSGYFMQWYAAVVDYPLDVGGRPYHSAPSFIPITFELTVLFAAFSAVLGMLALNRLPQPYHAVFNVEAFRRASQDRFFLCIEASDPLFDQHGTFQFLTELTGAEVYDVAP
jgi:hypothetical protein